MIIDTHTHIFPEKIKLDRTPFFDNEPEFKLLYNTEKSKICVIENLIESMDKHKVDLSIICGFPWRNPDLTKLNNDVIIESVQKYPNRIKGLACFDAAWEGAAQETLRCIKQGLSGAGELAFYLSGIDDKALDLLNPIMKVLKENNNLPCMIHTNEPVGHYYPGKTPITLEQVYKLAQKFPENKIILAHWGGGIWFYNAMKGKVKNILKNIWYDIAASPFLYTPQIYDIANAAGVLDKVLFGTDFPLLTPQRYYSDINHSDLNKDQIQLILGKNATTLFDCSQLEN